jgi:hypothetical protein
MSNSSDPRLLVNNYAIYVKNVPAHILEMESIPQLIAMIQEGLFIGVPVQEPAALASIVMGPNDRVITIPRADLPENTIHMGAAIAVMYYLATQYDIEFLDEETVSE